MPFRLRLACVVLILLFAALHATAAPIQTKGSPSTQSKGSPTKANVKASTVANNGSKLGKGGSKCGGNQIAGPCICEGDVSGLPGIGIRDANNIGKLCETRTLAYVYVNPDDQSSATTGDLEILTDSNGIAQAKKTKGKLNCDHIVELQYVKEEVANSINNAAICNRLRTDADAFNKFFKAINGQTNLVFGPLSQLAGVSRLRSNANQAKKVPVGRKRLGPGTIAQAAKGGADYIRRLLQPGAKDASSNDAAVAIDNAMTELMRGPGQGWAPGFTTRWRQRLEDSVIALNNAPSVTALSANLATATKKAPVHGPVGTSSGHGSTTASASSASGPPSAAGSSGAGTSNSKKRPASSLPPAGGSAPKKCKKTRSIFAVLGAFVRRVIGGTKSESCTLSAATVTVPEVTAKANGSAPRLAPQSTTFTKGSNKAGKV